jgi:tetratricopeptide (TPR) repeat protein
MWNPEVNPQTRPIILPALAILLILFGASSGWARSPQSNQDAVFTQAVDAYNHNQFPEATEKFKQVSGVHAQEAQQYIAKMKAYREAMEVANSVTARSPDERDANSLTYAIQQYQKAISIKPDGPWQPAEQLAKARAMKVEVEKAHAAISQTMDSQFCAKALAAAQDKHYKEAADLSCAVANDNPGYSCGGDEAVHLCQVNTDMAKLEGPEKTEPSAKPTPSAQPASEARASGLDNAKAAYDSNDFPRARTLLQHIEPQFKPAAVEFLDKIARYTSAMTNGEKLSRAGQYDAARDAFLSAASIKVDGPGDPRGRASMMQLFLGVDHFYSGDYPSAIQQLQECTHSDLQKQPLIRFYLGASELARFFVTGSEDSNLHQEALNDLKQAKQAGFQVPGNDVSPKILQVYKDITF